MPRQKVIILVAGAALLLFLFLSEPEPSPVVRRRQRVPTEPEGPDVLTVLKGAALAGGLAAVAGLAEEGIDEAVDLVTGEIREVVSPDTAITQKAITTTVKKAADLFNANPLTFDLAGFFNGSGSGTLGITEGGAVFVERSGLETISIEAQFNLPTTGQIIPGEIVGGAEEFIPGITGSTPGEGILSPTFAGLAGAAIGAIVGFGLSQIPILEDLTPFTAGAGLIVGGASAFALGASAGAVALGAALGGIGIIAFGLFAALSQPDREKEARKAGAGFALSIKPVLDQMAAETEKADLPVVLLGNLNEMVKQVGPKIITFMREMPEPQAAMTAMNTILDPTFARFDALFAKFGATPSAGLTRQIFWAAGTNLRGLDTLAKVFAALAVQEVQQRIIVAVPRPTITIGPVVTRATWTGFTATNILLLGSPFFRSPRFPPVLVRFVDPDTVQTEIPRQLRSTPPQGGFGFAQWVQVNSIRVESVSQVSLGDVGIFPIFDVQATELRTLPAPWNTLVPAFRVMTAVNIFFDPAQFIQPARLALGDLEGVSTVTLRPDDIAALLNDPVLAAVLQTPTVDIFCSEDEGVLRCADRSQQVD